MTEAVLTVEEADGAALLTLNRPEKRNALSRALREELVHCLDELEKSDGVRVAILTGAGPACSAGFDRSEFEGGQMAQVFADAVAYHRHVYTFAKPLYFAVDQLMPALEGRQGLDALIVTMETYVDAVATSGTLGRAYYELRRRRTRPGCCQGRGAAHLRTRILTQLMYGGVSE